LEPEEWLGPTECLEDPRVRSVLVVGRTPCGVAHPKLRELIRSNFFDYSDAKADLTGYDACFFCLGVSGTGMKEAVYHRLTYELTLSAAEALVNVSPGLTFCYVSGEGTDSTERGRFMWARVKGKTENHLLRMPLKGLHVPSRFHSAAQRCPLEDQAIPGSLRRTRAALSIAEAPAAESCDHHGERWSGHDPGGGQRVLEART